MSFIESTSWSGVELAHGRYRVDLRIHAGGMGEVYRGFDRNLDRDVIIKVPVLRYSTGDFAARFQREIKSLIRLNHPHIVKVLDCGEHGGIPFAVMPYLPGGNLEERLLAKKPGHAQQSLKKWLPPICDALDFVHREGCVHRDVKPSNILFDVEDHAYLSDFGVVRVLANEQIEILRKGLTKSGDIFGTPKFMAPEMVLGHEYNGAVDQYALGVILYEVFCCRAPFDAPSPTALLLAHVREMPPAPTAIASSVSESVSAIIMRALAKDPRARFPTCMSLATEMIAALDGAPLHSHASAAAIQSEGTVGRVGCPVCHVTMQIPDSAAGRTAKCPSCKSRLKVSVDRRRLTVISDGVRKEDYDVLETQKLSKSSIELTPRGMNLDQLSAEASHAPPVRAVFAAPTSARQRWMNKGTMWKGALATFACTVVGILFYVALSTSPLPRLEVDPITPQKVKVNSLWTFKIPVTNQEEFPKGLRFELGNDTPKSMSVERYTGQLTWQLNAIAPGVYPVQITVSPIGAVDAKSTINFDVSVYRDQTPPRVAIGAVYPQQPVVGDTVKVLLNADDSDGDAVTFQYRIEHPLMILDWIAATGPEISFTAKFAGDYQLHVRGRDHADLSSVTSQVVHVAATRADLIAGSAVVGQQPQLSPPPTTSSANNLKPSMGSASPSGDFNVSSMPTPRPYGVFDPDQLGLEAVGSELQAWLQMFQQYASNYYVLPEELQAEQRAITAIVELCRKDERHTDSLLQVIAIHRQGLPENRDEEHFDLSKYFTEDGRPERYRLTMQAAGVENAVIAIYNNKFPLGIKPGPRLGFAQIGRKDLAYLSVLSLVGEKAIPSLVRAAGQPEITRAACGLLGELGRPALDGIRTLLDSDDDKVCFCGIWAAALVLSGTDGKYQPFQSDQDRSLQSKLLNLFTHKNAAVRSAAITLLARWSDLDARDRATISNALVTQVAKPAEMPQHRAALLATFVKSPPQDFCDAVATSINNGFLPTANTLRCLLHFNASGGDLLAKLIDTGDAGDPDNVDVIEIRRRAVSAIAVKDDSSVPKCVIEAAGRALLEDDERLRYAALLGLRAVGKDCSYAKPSLEKALTDRRFSAVHRKFVKDCLENISDAP